MCLSQGQWARKNCWRFLEFSPSWPGFSGANLTGLLRLVLGWGEEFVWGGVCGGCLVAKGSASPSLGSRTLPKPHTKKQRATVGLVASLGWGPGLRLLDSDTARSVRPGSGGDPGQSRYSPWCAGGGGVLSGLLMATRRRRHAVGALGCGSPQLLDPASRL